MCSPGYATAAVHAAEEVTLQDWFGTRREVYVESGPQRFSPRSLSELPFHQIKAILRNPVCLLE
jgi:hypothetical protein